MHLLGLHNLSPVQIRQYLQHAARFVDDQGRVQTPEQDAKRLAGRWVGLLFYEPSNRTRVGFELATARLGGHTVLVEGTSSHWDRTESAVDMARNLEAMELEALVVRHSDRHVPETLVERVAIPVINAGNGSDEHPTQGLTDAFTLARHWGTDDFRGKTIAILGDVRQNRVAHSDMHAFTKLGARVIVAGPRALMPHEEDLTGAARVHTREAALAEADAIVVLRLQRDRLHAAVADLETYARHWCIDEHVLAHEMKPGAVILHPGPVMRGVEMTSRVADGPRCLQLQQVRLSLAMRQAVLTALLDPGWASAPQIPTR